MIAVVSSLLLNRKFTEFRCVLQNTKVVLLSCLRLLKLFLQLLNLVTLFQSLVL